MEILNLTNYKADIRWEAQKSCKKMLSDLSWPNFNFLFKRFRNYSWEDNLSAMLDECPVYIVESSQMGKYVTVPGMDMAVLVPNPEEPCDYLGIYQYKKDRTVTSRIFVWIDRVNESADNDADNAAALLFQVIMHEISHLLLNPEVYTSESSKTFNPKAPSCVFIEEAYANAMSLAMCYEEFDPSQQAFIKSFVQNQPAGYNLGFEVYEDDNLDDIIKSWLHAKVLFENDTQKHLDAMVENKDIVYLHLPDLHEKNLYCSDDWGKTPEIHLLVEDLYGFGTKFSDDGINWGLIDSKGVHILKPCFEDITFAGTFGNDTYYAVKHNGKYGIVKNDQFKTGFLYDSVWSYRDDGLCQVTIDGEKRCYGYIGCEGKEVITPIWHHLYKFENGITPAKLDNMYFIIDTKGDKLKALPSYDDVRAFRNGVAYVRKGNYWGLIDVNGDEVVPCQYEHFNDIPMP